MKYSEHLVCNWMEFEAVIAPYLEKGPEGPYIFRGQSNSSWKLELSLARALKTAELQKKAKPYILNQRFFGIFMAMQ